MADVDLKRLVKLWISLGYFAGGKLRRALFRIAGRPLPPSYTILYYHAVSSAEREAFCNQMAVLSRGNRVVPASFRGERSRGSNYVSITFDDAFVSVMQNAVPELASRSFHSTIFVPVGALGTRPAWQMESGARDGDEVVMTGPELRSLPESLVEFGAHSITHPHLTQVAADLAKTEIEDARQQLLDVTGRQIRLFAFPYGDFNPSVVSICKAAGYDHVYSIEPEAIDPARNGFLRGRTKVEPFDSKLEFYLKANGAYNWMTVASLVKRKLRSSF